MVFLPEKEINILFGEGRSVFDALGKDSDIGYINQIFIGGIFYLGFFFFFKGSFNEAFANMASMLRAVCVCCPAKDEYSFLTSTSGSITSGLFFLTITKPRLF
jgi:hypothetical protein